MSMIATDPLYPQIWFHLKLRMYHHKTSEIMAIMSVISGLKFVLYATRYKGIIPENSPLSSHGFWYLHL